MRKLGLRLTLKKYKKNKKLLYIDLIKNLVLYPNDTFDKLRRGDVLDIGFSGLEAKINQLKK